MAKSLSPEEWSAIRRVWEYDPDEPVNMESARRAAEKYGFSPPTKQAVAYRNKKEGWERKGSMVGIVQAAYRKADKLTPTDEETRQAKEKLTESLGKERAARVDAEDQRASVIARHRQEWQGVIAFREEAKAVRADDPNEAFTRSKAGEDPRGNIDLAAKWRAQSLGLG